MSVETRVSFRVEVDESTAEAYLRTADERGVSVEQVITERLAAAREFTSTKPIYLSDEQRQRLEALFKRNFSDPERVTTAIENLARVRVGGAIVDLSQDLLDKLQTRAIGISLKDLIKQEVVVALEQYVGMR